MITAGTRLEWSTLGEWVRVVRILDERRHCAARYAAERAHWAALPLALIEKAAADDVGAFLDELQSPYSRPWGKPHRGQRRGTKWEEANVRARNRVWILEREADRASIGLGHNSRAA